METIYKASLITYTFKMVRGESKCVNDHADEVLFTSKNKAIDRARSWADNLNYFKEYNAKLYWDLFASGKNKTLDTYMVCVDEYRECDGRLNFEDRHHLADTAQGKVYRYEDDPFFQAIV
jgi:hypothetical protein